MVFNMLQMYMSFLSRIRLLSALVGYSALCLIGASQMVHIAYSASCANANNYGVATLSVTVPASGDYRIWSRMKVPSTTANSYQLEADGNTCWQVGGASVPTNTWTWVDWHGGNSAQKINYTFTAGNHTLKFIGNSANVLVDKVVLLGSGEQCSDNTTTPTGDGANCANGPTVMATGGGSNSGSNTVSVGGSTTPSVVANNQANAVQTSYIVNGKVIQSSSGAKALDTTKLPNGTYTVQTIVKLKDGSEVTETQTITVNNSKSFLRRYRIYMLVIAVIVVVGALLVAIRLGKLKPGQFFARFLPAQSAAKSSAPTEMPQYSVTIIKPTHNTTQNQ